MSKQILTKLKEELQSMKDSKDVGYVKAIIPWNKNRRFSVECTRMEDDIYDEYDNVMVQSKGDLLEFTVYYQVDGKDVDSCTISWLLDKRDMEYLKDFVKMYR